MQTDDDLKGFYTANLGQQHVALLRMLIKWLKPQFCEVHDHLDELQRELKGDFKHMGLETANIKAAVEATEAVDNAAVAQLDDLDQKYTALAAVVPDNAEAQKVLDEFATSLNGFHDTLATAITKDTPPATEPPTPTPPAPQPPAPPVEEATEPTEPPAPTA